MTMKNVVLFVLITTFGGITSAQPYRSETEWEKYFKGKINHLDPIEGIWSRSITGTVLDAYSRIIFKEDFPQDGNVAIYKKNSSYLVYQIGSDKANDYSTLAFKNTASSGIYLFEVYYNGSRSTAKANAVFTGNGLLEFSYKKPVAQTKKDAGTTYIAGSRVTIDEQWIKISPKQQDYVKSQPSSGTGFAITSNGIIVTNSHVVEGAKKIGIRGVSGDFNRTYSAKVLVQDKNNDLALLKIDDYSFTSLGQIPFSFQTKASSVGESIFVLGYPLRASMGDEIKLTNGIISSKTGFQGDVTSYQISAPVQPGNSGGPLFNSQGNLIGIINAKHLEAENASYAVKSSYLLNLIDLLDYPPLLQKSSSVNGKQLTEQVSIVKMFVYIIEVN